MGSVAVTYRAFQPRDHQPFLGYDPPVDLRAFGVITAAAGRIVVATDEDQRCRVMRRQGVEVIGGQIPASDQKVHSTESRDGSLVEKLRLDLVADGQQPDVHRRLSGALL